MGIRFKPADVNDHDFDGNFTWELARTTFHSGCIKYSRYLKTSENTSYNIELPMLKMLCSLPNSNYLMQSGLKFLHWLPWEITYMHNKSKNYSSFCLLL